MSSAPPVVLLSWVAINNDPYVIRNGVKVAGPSLTLLTDETSPYRGRIADAVFFRQGGAEAPRFTQIYEDLVAVLGEQVPELRYHPQVFELEDPTDHTAIFELLREVIPRIRRMFRDRELVIHVSPGTPAMQTVWVLMAETGFIEPPFKLFQSRRAEDRRGRPTVVPVEIGIDTFYKRYRESRPASLAAPEQSVGWQPKFVSPRMIAVHGEARRLAQLKVPILILGERGTGKTQLAGWIRQWSPWCRADRRDWTTVACGQFTSETMRAELFGYRKGAFTDAKTDRSGLLKHLDGDTLFLDEIGDIPRELQRLLIKALEERTFLPIGSSSAESTDFRLISATNLPLSELRSRLDADFMDRISTFVLRVPALRDIPEDLGWLWDEVLVEAARRADVELRWTRMADPHRRRVLAALQSHPLPGNLRDLFRVAWRFLAARADDHAPLTVAAAVDDALTALTGESDPTSDRARAFARAFADSQPAPDQLFADGPVDADALLKEQRRWFAHEVARAAQDRGVAQATLVTVDGRTLLNWRKA